MAAGPDLPTLLALFPPASAIVAAADLVTGSQVPPPYHDLLVHVHHMTVTVEKHHGQSVDVIVLERRLDGDAYSRKILLARRGDRRVVQFGLVRIHFQYCSQEVRDEIVSERTPLGRVLINHDVLRVIEPTQYLRVTPGPDLMTWFGLAQPTTTYGRLAIIHCDGKPAVEVLEIVTPEP